MANNVGNVNSTQSQYGSQYYYDKYVKTQQSGNEETAEETSAAENAAATEQVASPEDTYTPSSQSGAVKPKDQATIDRLWNEAENAANTVRKMVAALLGKKEESGQVGWAYRAKDIDKIDISKIDVDEETRLEAEQMISEDGFYGVKNTTNRIMDFAKALVGEDASEEQIEEMRDAVQKGFDDVAKLFGGFDKLPDVTKQTYESVMKSFDDWKSGGASAGAVPGVTTTETA